MRPAFTELAPMEISIEWVKLLLSDFWNTVFLKGRRIFRFRVTISWAVILQMIITMRTEVVSFVGQCLFLFASFSSFWKVFVFSWTGLSYPVSTHLVNGRRFYLLSIAQSKRRGFRSRKRQGTRKVNYQISQNLTYQIKISNRFDCQILNTRYLHLNLKEVQLRISSYICLGSSWYVPLS